MKTPLCIHRAPLGTHERFSGLLGEHVAGNFPPWLAPEQARVITLGSEEPLLNFAKDVVNQLRARQIRAEGDSGNDAVEAKIAEAEQAKGHTMLVIGAGLIDGRVKSASTRRTTRRTTRRSP